MCGVCIMLFCLFNRLLRSLIIPLGKIIPRLTKVFFCDFNRIFWFWFFFLFNKSTVKHGDVQRLSFESDLSDEKLAELSPVRPFFRIILINYCENNTVFKCY